MFKGVYAKTKSINIQNKFVSIWYSDIYSKFIFKKYSTCKLLYISAHLFDFFKIASIIPIINASFIYKVHLKLRGWKRT